jgi:hypothetical protein
LCRSADMNPHQSQAFILDVSRGAAIGRVHDRYITSPRQVHDRLNQIQSLRGDTGKPLRPDAAARTAPRSAGSVARHGAGPVFHRAARTRSPPPWQPRRDGAGRCGSLPGRGCEQDQPAVRHEQNGREPAARDARNAPVRRAVRGPRNGTKRARIGKASGSTDRSFGPDAVRYMSVTIATPCPTAAHDDT